ncbi:MAG: phosphatidate cytidylyltransferase [Hespellia sp.]|nr:phosphatidate cytidylyltransferase [Hespellia sp.]
MFKTRLISGIVLVLVALVTIISGGPILFATMLIVSLIGMSELYKIFGIHKSGLGFVGYVFAVLYYGAIYLIQGDALMPLFMAFLIALLMVYVFSYPKYKADQIMAAFFGLFYVAVMLSYIFQIRRITGAGSFLVWLVFLCSWGCDACAYCVGVLFGKHKMAPVLSPKKSIEGAVGGVVGAAILGAVYALAVDYFGGVDVSPLAFAGICVVGGLISMVGDLAASAIKRNYEIKDYGKLIPGHGGILDRFDSVIFVAPIIYYLLTWIG